MPRGTSSRNNTTVPNKSLEFYVENIESLTPDSRSVEPSPTRQAFSSVPSKQKKLRKIRRTKQLNSLQDYVESESEPKTNPKSKTNKKKAKRRGNLLAVNDENPNQKTPEEKENDPSVMLTRSTRNRRKLPEKAVQDSTLSETSQVNDSYSFVTLRKSKTPKRNSDQNCTTLDDKKKTPIKSGVESESFSNKSTRGINLTYTPPSLQQQDNDRCADNCFSVQCKDVFNIVSNTSDQELGDFMLDGGESVLLSDTLYKKISVAPPLNRTNTFTITEPTFTPKPESNRKSNRKRWSQGEKNPVFGKSPFKEASKTTSEPDMESERSTMLKVSQATVERNHRKPSIFNNALKVDKSVSFFVPSPRVSVSKNVSKKTTINFDEHTRPSCSNTPRRSSESSVIVIDSSKSEKSMAIEDSVIILDSTNTERSMTAEATATQKSIMKMQTNKQTKQKKSVKLESPQFTPRNKKLQPLPIRKTPLLKTVFYGDNSILTANSVVTKGPTGPAAFSTPFRPETQDISNPKAKPSSKVKVPDFRKIHQRQFEKMEDIKEYQERRAARAQLLISGTKSNSSKNPDVSEKESKRKLMYSPAIQRTLPKAVQERAIKKASLEKKIMEKKQKVLASKVPKLVMSKPQQHLINKRNSLEQKRSLSPKKNHPAAKKPGIQTAVGRNKMLRKEEEVKAVATKSRVGTNLSERNRKQVVNVRTNRRFELLMKMREKEGKKS